MTSPSKAKKLKDVRRTRCIQHIDSYIVFEELVRMPAVHVHYITGYSPPKPVWGAIGTEWNWDGETINKANGFLYQQESSFLVCFGILLKTLFYLREITIKLQMQAIDVAYAYKQVSSVVTTLKKMNLERSMLMQLSWANLFMESTLSYRSQDLLAVRPIEASLMQQALKNIFESLFTMSLCHMLLQSWNNNLSTIPHTILHLACCAFSHRVCQPR